MFVCADLSIVVLTSDRIYPQTFKFKKLSLIFYAGDNLFYVIDERKNMYRLY